MPGGTVFPTAARELRRIERVRAQTQAKKGGEISLEAEYTPRALGEEDAKRAYKDLNTTLSDAERLRLKSLGDALVLNTKSIYDTTSDRRLKNGGKLAYEFENRRIRKVIREKRPLRIAPGIRARELNGLFESMRVEVDATKAILRAWRRYCIRKMWKEKAAQAIVIKRIQRIARGFITRRLVAEWFHSRQRMVVQWQARIRKFLDLVHHRPKVVKWQAGALGVQRIIRGFLARRRHWFLRMVMAVVRLQVPADCPFTLQPSILTIERFTLSLSPPLSLPVSVSVSPRTSSLSGPSPRHFGEAALPAPWPTASGSTSGPRSSSAMCVA